MSIESLVQSQSNDLEIVEFCALCNRVKSDGKLTIDGFNGEETTVVPACLKCAKKLDWSDVDEYNRPEGV